MLQRRLEEISLWAQLSACSPFFAGVAGLSSQPHPSLTHSPPRASSGHLPP